MLKDEQEQHLGITTTPTATTSWNNKDDDNDDNNNSNDDNNHMFEQQQLQLVTTSSFDSVKDGLKVSVCEGGKCLKDYQNKPLIVTWPA